MPYKILQLTVKPPFPEIDGGSLEISKMSKFYNSQSNFELDILTASTSKHPFIPEEFTKVIGEKSNIKSVALNTKPNWLVATKQLLTNNSYNLSRFRNKEFETKLIELLTSKKYDFVQCESIYMGQYFEIIRKHSEAKIILNCPNIEYELWRNLSENSGFIKKPYFYLLSKQLKKEEEHIWRNVDGILSISKKIKTAVNQHINSSKILTLPFYLDTNSYTPSIKTNIKNPSFFHIGAMDWMPNIEGINWFLNNVWKEISKPKQLYLAGKNMPDSLLYFTDKSVKNEGFVEDAKDFMARYDVMVVPLMSGSGIRIKIIEAMALGKCIISTSKGAEGIEYIEDENILIADTKEEFVNTINSLIANPDKINEIGNKARELAVNHYDFSLIETLLIPFLEKVKSNFA